MFVCIENLSKYIIFNLGSSIFFDSNRTESFKLKQIFTDSELKIFKSKVSLQNSRTLSVYPEPFKDESYLSSYLSSSSLERP